MIPKVLGMMAGTSCLFSRGEEIGMLKPHKKSHVAFAHKQELATMACGWLLGNLPPTPTPSTATATVTEPLDASPPVLAIINDLLNGTLDEKIVKMKTEDPRVQQAGRLTKDWGTWQLAKMLGRLANELDSTLGWKAYRDEFLQARDWQRCIDHADEASEEAETTDTSCTEGGQLSTSEDESASEDEQNPWADMDEKNPRADMVAAAVDGPTSPIPNPWVDMVERTEKASRVATARWGDGCCSACLLAPPQLYNGRGRWAGESYCAACWGAWRWNN